MAHGVTFRPARRDDLPAIVALLADDELGAEREAPALDPYVRAFEEIDADPRHVLVVGDVDGEVVACLQATVLPCLTHGGRSRAQFEGVRVDARLRGRGVGAELLAWSIAWARDHGCGVAQLTTDRRRTEARRFYESVGFEATHDGMKLDLGPSRSARPDLRSDP